MEGTQLQRGVHEAAIGCLLGTAVGDAIGLPYEGLSPGRAARLLGVPDRHRLLPGRGMVSDDTEHACLTAAAFIEADGDPARFAAALASRLRWWLAALPAGAGLATARSIVRLWLGVPPHRSGVASAGNGPVMRAAILGVLVPDPDSLGAWVDASSRITHSDPRALEGARIVAWAARLARDGGGLRPEDLESNLQRTGLPGDAGFRQWLDAARASDIAGEATPDFAWRLGLERGVSGFVVPTVAVALHATLRHPRDLRAAVAACIRCGGDTDTTAAVAGGLVGAAVGSSGVPADWLSGLWAAPRTVAWMRRLAEAAAVAGAGDGGAVPPWAWPCVPFRNLGFLAVVLAHGFRRLLPPYG